MALEYSWAEMSRNKKQANVEVTGAARLYRAASVWTAGLGIAAKVSRKTFKFLEFLQEIPDFGGKQLNVIIAKPMRTTGVRKTHRFTILKTLEPDIKNSTIKLFCLEA